MFLTAPLLLGAALWVAVPLPSDLKIGGSVQITDSGGRDLYEMRGPEYRQARWVPLREISHWLLLTTIFKEDRSFLLHHGIDPRALVQSLWSNLRHRRVVRGASTITMQTAKIVSRRSRRTLWRKAVEAVMALKMEILHDKQEILELYLNRVYYGNQQFGCEAAARFYFGRSASELSLAQSAYLTVVMPSPSASNPLRRSGDVQRRAQALLAAMARRGWIDREAYEIARRERVETIRPPRPFWAPQFVQRVLSEQGNAVYGLSRITTSLDLGMQREAGGILQANLAFLRDRGVHQGAVLVLDNATGQWLVWVGSADYWDERYGGQIDGCDILRQPGSALKPFLYATAFRHGFQPASILPDIRQSYRDTNNIFYVPKNYTREYSGPQRARVALGSSLNQPAVFLLSRIGTPIFMQSLHNFGFASLDRGDRYYGLGLALGSGEVTLRELVRAYAVLARGGVDLPPRSVLGRFNARGEPLDEEAPTARRVIDERTAYLVSSILSDNNARGLGFNEESPLAFPYQVAAKTGTSEGYRDNFCVGYTRRFTVGVWVGNFTGSEMYNVSGVSGAGPIFHAVMDMLHHRRLGGLPYGERSLEPAPQGMVKVRICPLSGMMPSGDCPNSVEEWFLPENEPHIACDWHVLVAVDKRNSRLAGMDTPPQQVDTRLFFRVPALFSQWAAENDMPPPPREISHLGRWEFKISNPANGGILQSLPDLPPQFQSIRLQLKTDLRRGVVHWLVDDQPLAAATWPFQVRWPIRRGTHVITARCDDPPLQHQVRVVVQ